MIKPHVLWPGLRRRPLLGTAFGLGLVALAASVRFLVDTHLPPGYPFLTFFPAVILTALLAGLWPGIIAAIAGGVVAGTFFMPPVGLALDQGAVIALTFYTFVVAVDVAVIHVMVTALEHLDRERERSAQLADQTEVMFAEMQHRVSNSLQLVSSLLLLQQAKVTDPAAIRALDDAGARVATLGRLHRALHNPAQEGLHMGRYLTDLCRDILAASGQPPVSVTIDAAPVEIGRDKLVPLSLIVAELFSNALEHAFAGGRAGRVAITLADAGGSMRLTMADDGPGLPAGFDPAASSSLGLTLARTLAEQIGGTLSMHTDGGAVATVIFPA
jgi:two-component system, sensor histidine kinase PdtaS